MIIKGDKIKLVQKIGNFDKIGDVFKVIDVENGVITFECDYGKGSMSYNEFEKYFEKVEPVIKKRVWSNWKYSVIKFKDIDGVIRDIPIYVRHNNKKVQIKGTDFKLKSEAVCCKEDFFNYYRGFELAKRRLIVKYLDAQVKTFAKSM